VHGLPIDRSSGIRDTYTCRLDSFLGCCDRNPCSISWQTSGKWIFSSASNGQCSKYSRRSSRPYCHAVPKLQVTAFVLDQTRHRAYQRMILHIFLLDCEYIFRNQDTPGPTRVICHEYEFPRHPRPSRTGNTARRTGSRYLGNCAVAPSRRYPSDCNL
jgi:hypothetical protein